MEENGLNEQQQFLLKYLQKKCDTREFITYRPFEAIMNLAITNPSPYELQIMNTVDELSDEQQAQVLQAFSQLILKQEEAE